MSMELIGLVVAALVGGVVGLWWRSRSREQTLESPTHLSPEEVQARLAERVASGDTINAIKLYRLLHGGNLKDAKDAVDAMKAGRAPVSSPGRQPLSGEAAPDAILRAIRDDNLIQAIKLYRDHHGVGLKEAKDAVEAMRAELRRG
jgi:ribosomal protein L7/L12